MKKISSSTLLTIFSKILILLLLAKAISLAIWFYLPNDGIELKVANNYQPKYQRVDFKSMIDKTVVQKKKQKVIKKELVKNGISITNMILKGLYGTDERGFAIIALKSSPKKTTIVSIGEKFEGYTLQYIRATNIVFIKSQKEYILSLEEIKNPSSITKVKKPYLKRNSQNNVSLSSEDNDGEAYNVSREDIQYYAKNPKQIWRDISIVEVKKGKKIKGFKIRRINPKSKLALLGLRKGDLIIKANNIVLSSYRDAIQLYKGIGKIDTMQIVVIRDNQEKELVYEIN